MAHPQQTSNRFDDAEAFHAWEGAQTGAWELHDGEAVAMAPERADHVRVKTNTWLAIRDGLRAGAIPCEAFVDGLGIRSPGPNSFKPDVIVSCGDRVPGDALHVEAPTILVEVLSPSTGDTDLGLKLQRYFDLPSVQHYLVIATRARRVIHYRRGEGSQLLTTIHISGDINLDLPGITLSLEAVYEGVSGPTREERSP